MKSNFYETSEDRTPEIKMSGSKLIVNTLSTSYINRSDIPESYNFKSTILRSEQYGRTVIVVTEDRQVKVLVNAGFPDVSEIWGLWDHRLPDWLRNEMKRAHDEVFPK